MSNGPRNARGRGAGDRPSADDGREPALVRHEERLLVGKERAPAGTVRARKRVETELVEARVPVEVEHVELERLPAGPDDSGRVERLPDGSFSLPVFAEEVVTTTRVVVRERVRVAKRTDTELEPVRARVRRELVELDEERGPTAGTAEKEGGPAGPLPAETKRFLGTSELAVASAAIAAVVVCAAVVDAVDVGDALLLVAALAAVYTFSRGLAKTGVRP
jgi:uncharacterized protein (TIGR02271 family)